MSSKVDLCPLETFRLYPPVFSVRVIKRAGEICKVVWSKGI